MSHCTCACHRDPGIRHVIPCCPESLTRSLLRGPHTRPEPERLRLLDDPVPVSPRHEARAAEEQWRSDAGVLKWSREQRP